MPSSHSIRHLALCGLLFLVSFHLRLHYVHTTEFIDPIRADAYKYFMIAGNLLESSTYSYDASAPYTPASYISPGFPLLVAAHLWVTESFDKALILLQISQSVLSALTTVMIFSVASGCLPVAAAFAVGLLLTFSPHFITFAGYGLTETLFTFLLALHLWLLARAIITRHLGILLLAALTAGLATLTRPVALLLFPALLTVSLYAGWFPPRRAAAAMICFIAVMAPWQTWSSQAAKQLPKKQDYLAGVIAFGSYPDFIHRTEAYKGYPYREDEEYGYMSQSPGNAFSVIAKRASAEPGKYLYWYLIGKTVCFWSWNMMESVGGPFIYAVGANLWTDTPVGRASLTLAHALHIGMSLCCFVLVMVIVVRIANRSCGKQTWTPAVALCLTVILYFSAMHVVLAGWPRYSVPAWPCLYLLAVFAITQGMRVLRERYLSRRPTHDS